MDLEKQAIDILQCFANNEPYQLGYSGGKDSDMILHLAKKRGVDGTRKHKDIINGQMTINGSIQNLNDVN